MLHIHYFHGKIVTHHCSDWSTNHFCWRWSCVLSSPVFPFHSVLNNEYNIKVILSPSIPPSLSTVECITFVLISFCDQKQFEEERVYLSLHVIATIKSSLDRNSRQKYEREQRKTGDCLLFRLRYISLFTYLLIFVWDLYFYWQSRKSPIHMPTEQPDRQNSAVVLRLFRVSSWQI